ncbi:hypothetical protein [Polaribacter aquimarinus]|uniref:hypothetical protein n=1 Tax=Polaribacter aquimarinus TaxID=2100726 RepID=UPI0015E82BA5|nr:hypothetical protein [Polaribacter aquimarinus]
MKVLKEEQRFTQPWLFLILGISIMVPIGIILKEFYKENSNVSLNEVIFIIMLILICTIPIFFFKLKTRIDENGIHYQFFPFHFSFKTISWKEIKNAHVRNYDPIGEYGGWGLKGGFPFNKKKGKAINVKGDIGIQLELQNNKKILIGTQKEIEAKQVLKTYLN